MKKKLLLTCMCLIALVSGAGVHAVWAAPYVDEPNPGVNETQVPVDTNISFHLKDDVADISADSVTVTVQRYGDASAATIIEDGVPVLLAGVTAVPASIDTADPRDFIISYDPPDHDDYRFGYE